MNRKPMLSVLIPNYNDEKHIERAIDSIVAQDYPSIELVIVDDGSTDDSVRVAERRLVKPTTLQRPRKRGLSREVVELAYPFGSLDVDNPKTFALAEASLRERR
ncbi:MAG: glycosyltransferase family 2 protein [Gammaproteobacteria bacterium]|nr:MAG: glycosyltransferase family 2 protein [Gammaproteobacteria bacterium]